MTATLPSMNGTILAISTIVIQYSVFSILTLFFLFVLFYFNFSGTLLFYTGFKEQYYQSEQQCFPFSHYLT